MRKNDCHWRPCTSNLSRKFRALAPKMPWAWAKARKRNKTQWSGTQLSFKYREQSRALSILNRDKTVRMVWLQFWESKVSHVSWISTQSSAQSMRAAPTISLSPSTSWMAGRSRSRPSPLRSIVALRRRIMSTRVGPCNCVVSASTSFA